MVNSKKRMHRGALRTQAEISKLEAARKLAFPHLYPDALTLSDAELAAKCEETSGVAPRAYEPTAAEIIDAVERGMRDSAPRATPNPTEERARKDARVLRAAAKRLAKVAPKNDADLPIAVLRKERAACEILTRLGYSLDAGYIPADLEGVAMYLTEIEPEVRAAQRGAQLAALGLPNALRNELAELLRLLDEALAANAFGERDRCIREERLREAHALVVSALGKR